jgi:phenylacetate-CoA ligase
VHFEVVDQHIGEQMPEGEIGELVIMTLRKEGAPLNIFPARSMRRCGLLTVRAASTRS